MAAPQAPVILSPASGSTFVDPRAPVHFLLDSYVTGAPIVIGALTQAPTNVQDLSASTGLPTWDAASFLLASDGTAGQYATSASVAAVNKVNFRDGNPASPVTFGAGGLDDKEILTIQCQIRAAATGSGIDGNQQLLISQEYEHEHGGSFGIGVTVGTTSALASTGVSSNQLTFTQELRAILCPNGEAFTVGRLRSFCNEVDPDWPSLAALAHFRLAIRPYSFNGLVPTQWRAAGVQLDLKYRDPTDVQGGFRISIYSDSALTALVHRETVFGEGLAYALPANTLTAGNTYYATAVRFNDAFEDSAVSSTVSFTMMANEAAAVVHAADEDLAVVYGLGWGIWLDNARCHRRTDDTTRDPATHNVFQYRLDRDELPLRNWWIGGFEEDGRDADYAELTSIAAVEAVPGSFYFDEGGEAGHANTLYFHTTNSTSPRGVDTDSHGVVAILTQPVSDVQRLKCGPGLHYEADCIVKTHVRVKQTIRDQAATTYPVPSGTLSLHNRGLMFNSWIGKGDVPGNVPRGLLAHRRPFDVWVVKRGAPWSTRLQPTAGLFEVPPGGLTDETLELTVGGRQQLEEAEKYTVDTIPETASDAPPEALGATKGLRAVGIGLNRYRVGLNVGTVTAWYIGGVLTGGATFDANTHIVTEDGAAANIVSERTYDCSLAEGVSTTSPPLLAVAALRRAGYPASQIVQATFDAIHAALPSQITVDSQCGIDDEADGLEVIGTLEQTGGFHVCRLGDRSLVAMPYKPTVPDAYTVVLQADDLLSDQKAHLEHDGLAEGASVTYTIVVDHKRTEKSGTWHTTAIPARTKIRGRNEVKTFCGSYNGALYVYTHCLPLAERWLVAFAARRRACLAFPGGTLLLWSRTGADPEGTGAWAADFFKVLEVDIDLASVGAKVDLQLEHVKRLTGQERAYRS